MRLLWGVLGFCVLLFAGGVVLAAAPSSGAMAAVRSEVLIRHAGTTIPPGQIVENVLILGHNVTVAGDVSQILVVLDGDVHLTRTSLTGIVVDLGGKIYQEQGARVNSMYQVKLHTPFWNGTLFGGMFSLLLWAALLIVEMCIVILSLLINYVLRNHLSEPLRLLEQSVRRAGLTGGLLSIAVLAIGALGAVTIIGLPIAGLLLVLYLIAGVVGVSLITYWVGTLALRYSPRTYPLWQSTLIGAGLLMSASSIPYIGLLLFLIAWIVGIGTLTLWWRNLWKSRHQKGLVQ